jgi:hypothetical protein
MSGNSYIVFDDGRNIRKLYGKNITPDSTMANSGLSEYQLYKMNRGKIRNLVMYDDNKQLGGDQQVCTLCNQRMIPMTKQELLHMNDNVHDDAGKRFTEKVERVPGYYSICNVSSLWKDKQ